MRAPCVRSAFLSCFCVRTFNLSVWNGPLTAVPGCSGDWWAPSCWQQHIVVLHRHFSLIEKWIIFNSTVCVCVRTFYSLMSFCRVSQMSRPHDDEQWWWKQTHAQVNGWPLTCFPLFWTHDWSCSGALEGVSTETPGGSDDRERVRGRIVMNEEEPWWASTVDPVSEPSELSWWLSVSVSSYRRTRLMSDPNRV